MQFSGRDIRNFMEDREMKKIVTLVVLLALFSAGCEAFKSSYDNMPQQVPTPIGNEGKEPQADGSKFVCEAVENVKVVASETPGSVTQTVLASASDDAVVEASAEKLAENATKISITSNGDLIVSFVIAKSDDETLSVCSVEGRAEGVKSGTITVDAFNDGANVDISKAINSGAFKIEFEAATDAASIMKAAASEDSADASIVEGSYFVTGLTVSEVKK